MADIIINGPEGRIEARYTHTKVDGAPVALVLPPHPEAGGTMNDKVTYALYKTFVDSGFNVMRFNYRGIGGSEGKFGDNDQILSDAAYVLDWLQGHNPGAKSCWVGGYDFGSWITMQLLMRRPEIDNFVAISPPAGSVDFSFLAPCPSSGMMVRGAEDFLVDRVELARLVTRLNEQGNIKVELYEIDGAGHNFEGRLKSMMLSVDAYISKVMVDADEKSRMNIEAKLLANNNDNVSDDYENDKVEEKLVG